MSQTTEVTARPTYSIVLHLIGKGRLDGIRFEYLPMKGELVTIKTLAGVTKYQVYQVENAVDLTDGIVITYHLFLAEI